MARIGGELACWAGRIAQQRQTCTPCHACSPPPDLSPFPYLRMGRPGRRLVPGFGGMWGGARWEWGGGRKE